MMNWCEYEMFEKLMKWVEKNRLCNQSIEKIEKGYTADRFLILFYLFAFFGCMLVAMLLAFALEEPVLAFISIGIYFGMMLIIIFVAFFYKKIYVFLRKINWMEDREP